eukprot:2307057-Rhodomonas_salina.1
MDSLRERRRELIKVGVSPTSIRVPRKRRQKEGQTELKESLKTIKSRFQQDPKALGNMRHDPHRGWTKHLDAASRRYYYFHLYTGQSTWEPPPEFPEEYQMLLEMRERDLERESRNAMAADEEDPEHGPDSPPLPAKRRKSSIALQPHRRSSIAGSKAPKSPEPTVEHDVVSDSPGVGRSLSSPDPPNASRWHICADAVNPSRPHDAVLGKQPSVRMKRLPSFKRHPSKGTMHPRPNKSQAATIMQCGIRNWIARKTMTAKFKCVDAWERFVHKYPHVFHMRIANLTKATVADLVRSSLTEQKEMEAITSQLHRLIVNLSKGPAGGSDDLRMSLDTSRDNPGEQSPGDKAKRDKDPTRKRNKA